MLLTDGHFLRLAVHGANFSVHVDRSLRLRCAKRSAFLAPHEDFFGHSVILGERRADRGGHASGYDAFVALARGQLGQHPDADRIIIFGELIGGCYPSSGVSLI